MAIKAMERGNWRLEEAVDNFFNNPPSPPPPERDSVDEGKIIQFFTKYKCNKNKNNNS